MKRQSPILLYVVIQNEILVDFIIKERDRQELSFVSSTDLEVKDWHSKVFHITYKYFCFATLPRKRGKCFLFTIDHY